MTWFLNEKPRKYPGGEIYQDLRLRIYNQDFSLIGFNLMLPSQYRCQSHPYQVVQIYSKYGLAQIMGIHHTTTLHVIMWEMASCSLPATCQVPLHWAVQLLVVHSGTHTHTHTHSPLSHTNILSSHRYVKGKKANRPACTSIHVTSHVYRS